MGGHLELSALLILAARIVGGCGSEKVTTCTDLCVHALQTSDVVETVNFLGLLLDGRCLRDYPVVRSLKAIRLGAQTWCHNWEMVQGLGILIEGEGYCRYDFSSYSASRKNSIRQAQDNLFVEKKSVEDFIPRASSDSPITEGTFTLVAISSFASSTEAVVHTGSPQEGFSTARVVVTAAAAAHEFLGFLVIGIQLGSFLLLSLMVSMKCCQYYQSRRIPRSRAEREDQLAGKEEERVSLQEIDANIDTNPSLSNLMGSRSTVAAGGATPPRAAPRGKKSGNRPTSVSTMGSSEFYDVNLEPVTLENVSAIEDSDL